MPKAHDEDIIYRVYDPVLDGHYANWRSRSHWTMRHNAQYVADRMNKWRKEEGHPLAVVKKYRLVEVEDD